MGAHTEAIPAVSILEQPEQTPASEAYVRSETVYEGVKERLDGYFAGRQPTLESLGAVRPPLEEAGSAGGHTILEYNQTNHKGCSSYKIHGVGFALPRKLAEVRDDEQKPTRAYFASAGNHGEAGSVVAPLFGLEATVLAAYYASQTKLGLSRRNGADVKDTFPSLKAASDEMMSQQECGEIAIPPYNDLDVIAGQSLMGVQLVEDLIARGVKGDVTVFAPVGGGGFISGLVTGSRYAIDVLGYGDQQPPFELTFVGVQMEGGDPARRAVANFLARKPHARMQDLYASGEPADKSNDGTLAVPGDLTLPTLADRSKVSGLDTVTKPQVAAVMKRLSGKLGKLIEPAGALSRAGALAWAERSAVHPRSDEGQTLVTYITGANVTDETYKEYMAALDRHMELQRAQMYAATEAHLGHIAGLAAASKRMLENRLREVALDRSCRASTPIQVRFTGRTALASSPTSQYRTGLVEPKPRIDGHRS